MNFLHLSVWCHAVSFALPDCLHAYIKCQFQHWNVLFQPYLLIVFATLKFGIHTEDCRRRGAVARLVFFDMSKVGLLRFWLIELKFFAVSSRSSLNKSIPWKGGFYVNILWRLLYCGFTTCSVYAVQLSGNLCNLPLGLLFHLSICCMSSSSLEPLTTPV